MLKKLFTTSISLIFNPSKEWAELSKKQTDDHKTFLTGYVIPFMGLILLATFFGVLFTRKEIDLQIALKESIVVLLSMFGGFFIASYLVQKVWYFFFRSELNMKLSQRFVGYSSSLLYCLNITISLLPAFFFLHFVVIYTIYIVWEGVIPFLEVKETEKLKFVSFSTAIIILTPMLISFFLVKLMPGLK